MTVSEVYANLCAPFPKKDIKWRIGATNGRKNRDGTWAQEPTQGLPLGYIDARVVMDRLDQVVGPDNWYASFDETRSGRVICNLTVLGVTKADGAGATDMEGEKGGLSDAFKRAAVHFGIGRYLYNPLHQDWVAVKVSGRGVYLRGDIEPFPYPLPEGDNVVKFEKTKKKPKEVKSEEDTKHDEAISAIEELFKLGMKTVGAEEFLARATGIMDHGYGGGDWKELSLNELRGLYQDLKKMIKNTKKEND